MRFFLQKTEKRRFENVYEFELQKASDVLVRELCKVKEGETCVITADTKSDKRVVDATARAVFAAGGKPMVLWTATPLGVGRMVDGFLPCASIKGALLEADCWIEYNSMYFLYSATQEEISHTNKKLRYLCLPGMHTDVYIRLFARTDHAAMRELLNAVRDKIRASKHVRLTTAAGEDVEFDNHPDHPVNARDGYADKPGVWMLAGMISWAPDLDTVNGVIVFDGSLVPQFGVLDTPVRVYMKNGVIDHVEGGASPRSGSSLCTASTTPRCCGRPAHRADLICFPELPITGYDYICAARRPVEEGAVLSAPACENRMYAVSVNRARGTKPFCGCSRPGPGRNLLAANQTDGYLLNYQRIEKAGGALALSAF